MAETGNETDRATHIIRRIARVWSILIIIIGVVILVGEIYELFNQAEALVQPYPWYENLIPLGLITAVLGLVLAWRWEGPGAMLTILSVLVVLFVFYGIIGGRGEQPWIVALIMLAVLVPALLFLASWWRSQPGRDAAA